MGDFVVALMSRWLGPQGELSKPNVDIRRCHFFHTSLVTLASIHVFTRCPYLEPLKGRVGSWAPLDPGTSARVGIGIVGAFAAATLGSTSSSACGAALCACIAPRGNSRS